jgi:hypothetical protein
MSTREQICMHCGVMFLSDSHSTRRLCDACRPICAKESKARSHAKNEAHGELSRRASAAFMLAHQDMKQRSCIYCGKVFSSVGPENRKCKHGREKEGMYVKETTGGSPP